MSAPRHKPKRDASEPEIIEALKLCGYAVERLHEPLDLLCAKHDTGETILVECKVRGNKVEHQKNGKQRKFIERWPGRVLIFHDADEVFAHFRRAA